jgi:hypothetical protein
MVLLLLFNSNDMVCYFSWEGTRCVRHLRANTCSREEALQAFYAYDAHVIAPLKHDKNKSMFKALEPPLLQPGVPDQPGLLHNLVIVEVVIIIVIALLFSFLLWKLL